MTTAASSFAASTTSMDGALFAASLTQFPTVMSHSSITAENERKTSILTANESDEGRYVHPTSMKLYRKCGRKLGFLRYFPIFGEAVECYGPKFMFTLDFTQFLSKGIAYTIIYNALYPIFTEYYKANTIQYNRYNTVAMMGWSIKPFTALISDSFAVFQYKKRWLLGISALLLGALCSLILAFLPHKSSSAVAGALLAFLVGLGQANIDILSEGMYARRIRDRPSAGPNLVSTIWILSNIANIIGSVTQGPLSDGGFAWVGMVICGVCMAICAPVLLLNGFEEKPNRLERIQDAALRREQREEQQKKETAEKESVTDIFEEDSKSNVVEPYGHPFQSTIAEEDAENVNLEEELVVLTYCGGVLEFNKEVIVGNWRISVFCGIMTVVVVVTAIVTALYEGWVLLGVAAGGAILLSVLFFWALPLTVSKAGFYAFLAQALYMNLNSPLNGFYLENPACPSSNLPQFSYAFYNSITGVIGGFAGLAGVVAFNYIFAKSTYRLSFIVTVALYVIGSVFDLIMVKRWNLPAIPDQYFYVFGDAILSQAAYMLNWMPMCILLAQLCPRGSEAMVYALLAAFSNYGQTIAGEIGTLLMEFVWPVNASTCEFGNLWKLIVLGHLGLPLLEIPLVFLLIPKARICDRLNADGKAIKATRESCASAEEQEVDA